MKFQRQAAESALDIVTAVVRSNNFRGATSWLDKLRDELDDLTEKVQTKLRQADNFAKDLGDELQGAMDDIDHKCDTMINDVQATWDQKSAEINNFVTQQQAELSQLGLDLQKVINGATADLVRDAKKECEKYKNDDTFLIAARQSLDRFDRLQQRAFDSLDKMIRNTVGELVIVEHVGLRGTITAAADDAGQRPFIITIRGLFGGFRPFTFELEWMPWHPGADDMALFKRLTDMVMAFLKGDEVGLKRIG